jgi:hypothetical protein
MTLAADYMVRKTYFKGFEQDRNRNFSERPSLLPVPKLIGHSFEEDCNKLLRFEEMQQTYWSEED